MRSRCECAESSSTRKPHPTSEKEHGEGKQEAYRKKWQKTAKNAQPPHLLNLLHLEVFITKLHHAVFMYVKLNVLCLFII